MTCVFKDRIEDSLLVRENTGQIKRVFWYVLRSIFDFKLAHFKPIFLQKILVFLLVRHNPLELPYYLFSSLIETFLEYRGIGSKKNILQTIEQLIQLS